MNLCPTRIKKTRNPTAPSMVLYRILLLLTVWRSVTAQLEVLSVHGSGPTIFEEYVRTIADKFSDYSRVPVRITYRGISENAAEDDFEGVTPGASGPSDFMASGVPLSTAVRASMASRELRPFQFMAGFRTIAPFANFPTMRNVDLHLNLTACDLARILTGDIVSWRGAGFKNFTNQPDYDKTFPMVNVTGNSTLEDVYKITLVVIKGNIAATRFVTKYLDRACPSVWTAGLQVTANVLINNPKLNVITVDNEEQLHRMVWITPYSMGWSDAMTPLERGLMVFALESTLGEYVHPDAHAAGETIHHVFTMDNNGQHWPGADGDWSNLSFTYADNCNDWPIVITLWIMIQGDDLASSRASLLKAFVRMFYDFDHQKTIADPLHYGPLHPDVIAYFEGELNRLIPDVGLTDIGPFYFEQGSISRDHPLSVSSYRSTHWFSQLETLSNEIVEIKERIFQTLPLMIDGSGSSAVGMFLGLVMSKLRDRSKVPVQMGFRATGTLAGVEEFLGRSNNYMAYVPFGIGETVLSTEDYTEVRHRGEEVLQLPICLSTIGFFHSVPGIDETTGPLNLSACVLSKIYTRKIVTWNAPEILELNPNWRRWAFDNSNKNFKIQFNYRIGGSALTYKVSQYFNEASKIMCPGVFAHEPTYIARSVFSQGEGIVLTTKDSEAVDHLEKTEFALSYMAVGTAREKELKPVQIDSKDHIYMNPYDADPRNVIDINEFPHSPLDDYKGLNVIYRSGEKAYPLSMISYLWMRRDNLALGEAGQLLKAFATLLLSDESQSLLADFHFFALPKDLLEFSRKAVPLLHVDPTSMPYLFETDTALTGIGAGPRVLSSLRSSIDSYQMQQVYTSIEKTEEKIRESVLKIKERVENLEAAAYPDEMARGIGASALAFGVFGTVLAVVDIWLMYTCVVTRRYLLKNARVSSDDSEFGSGADSKPGKTSSKF